MTQTKIDLYDKLPEKIDEGSVGLIIKHFNRNPPQRHTGFIITTSDAEKPLLAHVAFKNDYRLQSNGLNGYAVLWLSFLPIRTAVVLAAELRALGIKGIIPYGITNNGGTRFEQGNVIPNPSVEGDSLTCSTFVLCMLEQQGFPIINRDSWEIPSEDILWQKNIVDILKSQLQPLFYEVQKENVGKVIRIRPEQIVGACGIFDFAPVEYKDACIAADVVIEELDKLGC